MSVRFSGCPWLRPIQANKVCWRLVFWLLKRNSLQVGLGSRYLLHVCFINYNIGGRFVLMRPLSTALTLNSERWLTLVTLLKVCRVKSLQVYSCCLYRLKMHTICKFQVLLTLNGPHYFVFIVADWRSVELYLGWLFELKLIICQFWRQNSLVVIG